MTQQKRGIDWLELIVGLLFLVAGIVSIFNPGFTLSWLVVMIGIVAIIRGIAHIVHYFRLRRYTGYSAVLAIVIGVLDIVLGVFILFNTSAGVAALAVLFPIWFIVDCIFNFAFVGILKLQSKALYWCTIILNILGIVLGVVLLFNPLTSAGTLAMLISFYLILFGVESIALAFANRNLPDPA